MPEFRLFSLEHITVLVLTLSICAGVLSLRRINLPEVWSKAGSTILISMFIAYALISYGRIIINDSFTLQTGLPLHLCDVLVIFCILAILTRNPLLFESSYFLGLSGTLPTLFTPNLESGFPTLHCIIFFWMHGLIIVAICYMIGVYGLRPRPRCILRMFFIINAYVLSAMAVNILTGANYGFLRHPPMNQENLILAISRWAPWPWYILVLEIIVLLSFFIYYAPWLVKDRLTKNKT